MSENTLDDQVIATEYIYLDEISNPFSTNNSLPTFGPSYIYLYNQPYHVTSRKTAKLLDSDFNKNDINSVCEICSSVNKTVDDNKSQLSAANEVQLSINSSSNLLNKNNSTDCYNKTNNLITTSSCFKCFDANYYVGRMLISINSSKIDTQSTVKIKKPDRNADRIDKSKLSKRENFLLFASINEIILNENAAKYTASDLNFRLNICNFGYIQDSNSSNITNTLKSCSLSTDMPYYVPINKRIPCLYLKFDLEDTSDIIKKTNYLTNKSKLLVRLTHKLNPHSCLILNFYIKEIKV